MLANQDLKILLIDDNKLFRDSLALFLEKHHFQVLAKIDQLEQAWSFFKEKKVSVVFLDLVMPEQDSINFLSKMKNMYPHIPVIVCSSLKQEHVIAKALEAGCFDYLVKPLDEHRIIECLQSFSKAA